MIVAYQILMIECYVAACVAKIDIQMLSMFYRVYKSIITRLLDANMI